MSFFKSVGKAFKSVLPAAAAAVGAYYGGPAGASAGYSAGSSLTGGDSSGFGNIVQGIVGLGQDNLAAATQWQYSKMASDYAFNQNLKMWNMQNAYNDPSAQMARLKAAGLNPNLVYGGGNVTGNTSGNAPQYDTPKVSYEDRTIQRQQLRLALEEHQQAVTNQAIENDLARQRLVLQEREANRNDALAQAQINAYKANLGMIDANIGNINFGNSMERYKSDLAAWQNNYNIFYDLYRKGKINYKELYDRVGRRPMLRDYKN